MTNEEFIESIKLEGEEWRTIPNWERYAVSSFGRIVAYDLPYLCGKRACRREPQLIKPRLNNNKPQYLSVVLSNGEKIRKDFLVHRLVAITFIQNPYGLPYINHKDENPLNNNVENLEWCTHQYNCNYGSHNARMAKTLHETAYQRKKVVQLTLDKVFIAEHISIREASKNTGAHEGCISLCCRKKISHGGGFYWMYAEDYKSLVKQDVKELSPNG